MIRDTLIIIDDSELDLAILNEIFKGLFQVECFSDARRGLTYLHHNSQRVCAVLLDICLERRGEGFTILHQLQGNAETVSVPVVLITTDANEKDVRASVEWGAVDFLVKPVDPHTVQERVCNVVRSAWPPASTILDGQPEAEEPAETEQPVQMFPNGLSTEEALAVSRQWMEKLEMFCSLRPGLHLEQMRQLGAITTLLARTYVHRHPHQKMTEADAVLIGRAAVFCDIGLLALPDRVLEGGEDQEGADAQLYYQHTQLGCDLLTRKGEPVALLRHAADIAKWHHKNVDGSGYPVDADGSEIPISAQLARTALRIQRYLHYYRGCEDDVERMLRSLRGEIGVTIERELYETVDACLDQLAVLLHSN